MGDLNKWAGTEKDKKQLVESVRGRLGELLTKNGMQFGSVRIGDFLDYEDGVWEAYGSDLERCGYSRDDRDGLFTDLIYEAQKPLLESHANAFDANRGKAYSKDYIHETLAKPALEKTGKWLVEEVRDDVPPDCLDDDSRFDDEPLPDDDDAEDDPEDEESSDALDGQNSGTNSDTKDSDKTAQTNTNTGKGKDKKKEAEKAAQAAEAANKEKSKQDDRRMENELSGLHELGALSDNEYRCGMALGQVMTMSVKNAPVMRALLDPINYLTTSQRSSLYGKHVARMLEKELKRSQKLDAEIASLYDDIKERGKNRAERIQNGEKVDLEKEAGKKSDKRPQEQKDGNESGKSGEKRSVLSWLGDKIHRSSGKDDVKDEPEEAVNQPEADEGTVSGEDGKAKKFGKAALTAVQTGAAGLAGCLTGVTLGIWNKAKNIGDVIRRTPAYQTFAQFPPVMWLKDTAHKISDSIKEARESHKAAGDHDCTKEGNEVTFVSNIDPCPEKIPPEEDFVKALETVVKYFNAKGFSVQIVQNEPEKATEATREAAAPTVEAEQGVKPETIEEPVPERPLSVDESTVMAEKGPERPQEAQDGHEGQDTAPKPETAVEGSDGPQDGQDGVKGQVTAPVAETPEKGPDGPQETPNAADGQDTASKPKTAMEGSDGPQDGQDGVKGQVTAPVAETPEKGAEEPQDADSETDLAVNAGEALRRGTSDKTDHKDTPVSHTMAELNRRAAEMNNDAEAEDDKESQGLNGIG